MNNKLVLADRIEEIKYEIKKAQKRASAAKRNSEKAFDEGNDEKANKYQEKQYKEEDLVKELKKNLETLNNQYDEVLKTPSNTALAKHVQELELQDEVVEVIEVEVMDSRDDLENFKEEKREQQELETPENTAEVAAEEPEAEPEEVKVKKPRAKYRKDGKQIKGDWPQHSYRIEKPLYEDLGKHLRSELGHGMSSFDTYTNMSRSLNEADFYGHIGFILERTQEQLQRFIRAYKAMQQGKFDQLGKYEQEMLQTEFYKWRASTDSEKNEMAKKLLYLSKCIDDVDLHEFIKLKNSSEYTQNLRSLAHNTIKPSKAG